VEMLESLKEIKEKISLLDETKNKNTI